MSDRPILMPADTPDYMVEAWAGALCWAASEKDIMNAFLDETKIQVRIPANGLDAMIDAATGVDQAIADKFTLWFNENVWGKIGGDDEPTATQVDRG